MLRWDAAILSIAVVSAAGVGAAIWQIRVILEKLLAAERAADGANKEYKLVLEEYRYALAEYEKARKPPQVFTATPVRPRKRSAVNWKGDVADG